MDGPAESCSFTTSSLVCRDSANIPSCRQLQFSIGGLYGGATRPSVRSARLHRWAELYELARADERTLSREKHFKIVKIAGDGRCLFRALARGLSRNKGAYVGGENETAAADELRMAVYDALCRTPERRQLFSEVLYTVNTEGGLDSYCRRLKRPDFWGGEVELLILSRMLKTPIYVFRTAEEAGRGGYGFSPIVKYGQEFSKSKGERKARHAVNLLYSQGNHYDLLL